MCTDNDFRTVVSCTLRYIFGTTRTLEKGLVQDLDSDPMDFFRMDGRFTSTRKFRGYLMCGIQFLCSQETNSSSLVQKHTPS